MASTRNVCTSKSRCNYGISSGALDTLNELAAAINDDANFSTTITNSIAAKAPLASAKPYGTPTAPTAIASTNNTQIATTAYVTSAISAVGAVALQILVLGQFSIWRRFFSI